MDTYKPTHKHARREKEVVYIRIYSPHYTIVYNQKCTTYEQSCQSSAPVDCVVVMWGGDSVRGQSMADYNVKIFDQNQNGKSGFRK